MRIIKEHLGCLNDNPEKLWFKRKLYGWGWTPARPQGWLVILVYILSIIPFSLNISESSTRSEVILNFFLPILILTSVLILICYKKGEAPRWQWGDPNK